MDSIATNVASAISPLVNKNKELGSVGNRLEHAVAQSANLVKTQKKDQFVSAASLAATAAATAGVAKSKTAQNVLTQGFKKVANSNFGKQVTEAFGECKPYLKKAADYVSNLPKPAKAVLGAGLILTSTISTMIRNKGMAESGRIEQKYVDKAKLQSVL